MCLGRFVEETVVGVLVLLVRAVVEAVTERPVVNAAEPAPPIRPGTGEPLHVVRRPGALYLRNIVPPPVPLLPGQHGGGRAALRSIQTVF